MIYFVLCPSYHGATLLSLLLNNHPELHGLGDGNPRLDRDSTCTCGVKVSACPFWTGLSRHMGLEHEKAPQLLPTVPRFVGVESVDAKLTAAVARLPDAAVRGLARLLPPLRAFRATYARFIEYCQSAKPGSHFLDGEKSLAKYHAVRSLGFDVGGIVHLVRDPRAYADSVPRYRPGATLEASVTEWRHLHASIRGAARTVRCHQIRYEDLALNPEAALHGLQSFLGVRPMPLAFAPASKARMHLLGNRSRNSFDGTIRNEERWRERWSQAESDRILELAEPLYSQFGYPAFYSNQSPSMAEPVPS